MDEIFPVFISTPETCSGPSELLFHIQQLNAIYHAFPVDDETTNLKPSTDRTSDCVDKNYVRLFVSVVVNGPVERLTPATGHAHRTHQRSLP